MSHVLAIALLLLFSILGMTNIATAYGEDRPLKIITRRGDDTAEVNVEKDKTTVSIHSPFGISQAAIERNGQSWPDVLNMRLNLKGLEQLKVTTGKITLEAAVSSQDGKLRLWKEGKEDSPLDLKDPFWMEIRMIGKDGKPMTTIPLAAVISRCSCPKPCSKTIRSRSR